MARMHVSDHSVMATGDGTYYYLWLNGVRFLRYNPTTKEVAMEGDVVTNETF